MALKKKDFVEIEFTGKVKDGEIFDSNIKEDIEKAGLNVKPRPFIFPLGEDMFMKSLDDFLIGKEVGKTYEIDLEPEKAFGKRDSQLIQMIPSRVFKEHNINPIVGVNFNFDGKVGKILAVSGGRVMVDFNHLLAGKKVEYKIKILKKIENLDEKIKALNQFFFRKDFNFKVEGKKIFMDVEKPMVKLVELFRGKFKDVLGLDLEIKEIEEKKESPESKSQ